MRKRCGKPLRQGQEEEEGRRGGNVKYSIRCQEFLPRIRRARRDSPRTCVHTRVRERPRETLPNLSLACTRSRPLVLSPRHIQFDWRYMSVLCVCTEMFGLLVHFLFVVSKIIHNPMGSNILYLLSRARVDPASPFALFSIQFSVWNNKKNKKSILPKLYSRFF